MYHPPDKRFLDDRELFRITVNISDENRCVLYRYHRLGTSLEPPYVSTAFYAKGLGIFTDVDSASDSVKNFMNTIAEPKVQPGEGRRYKMIINGLPGKLFTIHLKKSGAVVAKTVLSGKESRVTEVRVTCDDGTIPDVVGIDIHGIHQGNQIHESVELTPELKKILDFRNYDIAANVASKFIKFFSG